MERKNSEKEEKNNGVSDGSKNSGSMKAINNKGKGTNNEVSDGTKNSENKATTKVVPEKPNNSNGKGENKEIRVGSKRDGKNNDISVGSKKSDSTNNGKTASVRSEELETVEKKKSGSTEKGKTASVPSKEFKSDEEKKSVSKESGKKASVEPKEFKKVEKSKDRIQGWRLASLADIKGHLTSITKILEKDETVGLSDGWVDKRGGFAKELKSDLKNVLLVKEQGCPSVQPGPEGVNKAAKEKNVIKSNKDGIAEIKSKHLR